MANICSYKVLVKGRKNGCYAFYGSMQTLDGKSIIDETGTDEDYELRFEGGVYDDTASEECKRSICVVFAAVFLGASGIDTP